MMASDRFSFRMKQWIKQAVQNIVLPVCYSLHRGRKTDPDLVLFADAHHSGRPPAMELLYQRLKREGTWRIEEDYMDYASAGPAAVAKHSVSFMKKYAGAGFVILCDNFLPAASCRKKRQTKVIQLWHACGCYKKFGYDAPDDIPPDYRGGNVYGNTDLVTVSGKACVRAFAGAMRLPERKVRALGVSRTDLLLDDGWRQRCRERFYMKYPQARGKKVLLWAPTFRGNAGRPEGISLDLHALQAALGEDWLVLSRLHPHMMHERKSSAALQSVDADPFFCGIPTEELYPVTDVLAADYSSLIYEYLLFRKPIVLFVPDLEEYRAKRGFYMDITRIPGALVTSEQDLPGAVLKAVSGTRTEDAEAIGRFLHVYMGACDGHATERIVQWMRQSRGQGGCEISGSGV